MKKLPTEVFVQWSDDAAETDPDSAYLMAFEDQEAACNYTGERVGIYRLVEVVDITETKTHTRKKVK